MVCMVQVAIWNVDVELQLVIVQLVLALQTVVVDMASQEKIVRVSMVLL